MNMTDAELMKMIDLKIIDAGHVNRELVILLSDGSRYALAYKLEAARKAEAK